MTQSEHRPCDMKTCTSNRALGICGANGIRVTADKDGRPICKTYKRDPAAEQSCYDIEAEALPQPPARATNLCKPAAPAEGTT